MYINSKHLDFNLATRGKGLLELRHPLNYESQDQECESQIYEHVFCTLGDKQHVDTAWPFCVLEDHHVERAQ